MIISRTPFRISFFGGGSDYPAWYRKYGGKVLGTSVDKYCYISCRYLPAFFDHKYRIVYSKVEYAKRLDEIKHPAVKAALKLLGIMEGVEIHHDGDLPAKSGLGSSSAFTVGLIHALYALRERIMSQRELAAKAVHVEREILKENVGSQDQVLTAVGGFNVIEFRQDDSFNVTPVILSKEKIEMLQKHMMLFFTGFTRVASKIAKSHIKHLEARKRDVQIMQQMVSEAVAILEQKTKSLIQFGHLLDESWQFKRSSTNGRATTPAIDAIYNAAKGAGAIGGKILGAGAGGFMLLFVEPELQDKVRKRLNKLTYVPFRFDFSGSKIVVFEPNNFQ